MAKSKTSSGIGSVLFVIGKLLLLCFLPHIFALLILYGLCYFIINLIAFAVNGSIKGRKAAKSTFSDHMHELFVALLNFMKDYVFLIIK